MRQIRERDASADVRVVVTDAADDRFGVDGATLVVAERDEGRGQADKVASSAFLWDASGRTFVLFGDVRWSDAAIDAVVACRRPWTAFARFGPSSWTGCDHGELFGFAFDAVEQGRMRAAVERVVALAEGGRLVDYSGGWEVFLAAAGADDAFVCGADAVAGAGANFGRFAVTIDDETDDVDTMDDLRALRAAVARVER